MIRHIVWDWNGTLLDDVDSCVATLNSLRADRALPPLGRDEYRARFGFPVRAFYEGIGFDFGREDFAALSEAFIARYRERAAEMRVTTGAADLLARTRAAGYRHVVISAMEQRLLGEMLGEHGLLPELAGFFGRSDLSAGSKVDHGVAAIRGLGLHPEEVLVVGDTLHDLELGEAIGCRAILYAGGHQSRERLAAAGVPVVEALAEVFAVIPPRPV